MISSLLAAISFDPTIRGIAVVVVAVVVLIGSIFMVISTNSGARSGFLIAGAGLFGWMFIMGMIWWMYGIGLKGRAPAWMAQEINFDRGVPAATAELNKLPTTDELPDPVELMNEHPLLLAVAKGSEGAKFQPESLSNVVTVATPLVLVKPGDLDPATRAQIEKNARDVIEANPEVEDALQLSDAELATKISDEARALRNSIEEELNGWCLLSESDPRRGEAAASADVALIGEKAFGDPTTTSSYILQDVFFYGGKEPCTPIQEKSTFGQAWSRIASTFEIKHPKLLSAVTVKKANDTTVPAGETPPAPSVVEGATPVTVVLLRNLGNLRFIPFAFAVVNGLLFAVFVIVLHSRDKLAMANKAAFEASKA